MSAQAIKFLLNMGSTVVLARLLTPADFGLVAMVAAFTGFIGLFQDLGLSVATVQRAEITHSQVSTLFWLNVALSTLLMGVAATLAPAVAWFYGDPRLLTIMFVIAGSFIFGGLTAQHTALLRRQMRFTALASVEVLSMVAGTATAITMVWWGCGYWGLVVMGVARAFVNMVLVWCCVPWRPGWPRRGTEVMPMIKFGGNLTGCNVLNYLIRNLDDVLIGATLGASPLGIYSKAYNLLMMPIRQISSPMGAVALPALCRLQSDPARYRRYYLKGLGLIAFLGMPLVAFTFVEASDLVRVVLGPQWTAVIPVFRWLAPAAFMGTLSVAPDWLCDSLGYPERRFRWAMLSAPTTVVAFALGLRWGAPGVAAAFSMSWCGLLLIFIPYSCAGSPVRVMDLVRSLWRPIAAPLAAALATAACSPIMGTGLSPVLRLVLSASLFALLLLGAWLVLPAGPRTLRDLFHALTDLRPKAA